MNYLERYKNGEYEQVWAELLALGGTIREEPLYSEALAVAHETMTRVRNNVELLFQRLKDLNYQFLYPEMAYIAPQPETINLIQKLEGQGGILPISVRVFFEEVGSVYFLGAHPKLSERIDIKIEQPYEMHVYSDPIAITPPDSDELESYEIDVSFDTENIDEDGQIITPYSLEIAPDEVHKAGYSGGGPYEIYFPDLAIDAPLQNWSKKVTFVEYLRICFQWGGFPGLAWIEEVAKNKNDLIEKATKNILKGRTYDQVPARTKEAIQNIEKSYEEISQSVVPKEELAYLTADLLPF